MTTSTGAGSLGLVETRTVRLFDEHDPLVLESGATLAPVEVAYETYGTLNAERTNAVYVCHALTGDAHAAGHHGDETRPGWWDSMIGPGKPIDTTQLYVICSNLLGGCNGTTGPSSIDPTTGEPYGLRFPLLAMADLVTVHRALCRRLGIDHLRCVIGGSLGGMQALQWVLDAPGELDSVVLACATSQLSAQNIAFSEVARQSIMRDPEFDGGDYYAGRGPRNGLAVARMVGHITYLSEHSMQERFGRRLQHGGTHPHGRFEIDFAIESYLHYQGDGFAERFDANTYLYYTRVLDSFDPFPDERAPVPALAASATRFLVLSFSSDWRFGTPHSERITRILEQNGVPVRAREIESPYGHDSFLLPVPDYLAEVQEFVRDLQ
ncbi:MAG: homoserine O-acetyltransferase [Gaiellales bacterium]